MTDRIKSVGTSRGRPPVDKEAVNRSRSEKVKAAWARRKAANPAPGGAQPLVDEYNQQVEQARPLIQVLLSDLDPDMLQAGLMETLKALGQPQDLAVIDQAVDLFTKQMTRPRMFAIFALRSAAIRKLLLGMVEASHIQPSTKVKAAVLLHAVDKDEVIVARELMILPTPDPDKEPHDSQLARMARQITLLAEAVLKHTDPDTRRRIYEAVEDMEARDEAGVTTYRVLGSGEDD